MNPLSDTESEPDQFAPPEEKVVLEKKSKKTRKVKVQEKVEHLEVEAPAPEEPVKKKRVMSEEQKAKMQAARKAKAAERKAAKEAATPEPEPVSPEPVPEKKSVLEKRKWLNQNLNLLNNLNQSRRSGRLAKKRKLNQKHQIL